MPPYDETEGYNSAETSRERAESRRDSGEKDRDADRIVAFLLAVGPHGWACCEHGEGGAGLTHQTYSGAIRGLHRVGRVARLDEKRSSTLNGRKGYVHVHPSFVNGRTTLAPVESQRGVPRDVREAAHRLDIVLPQSDPNLMFQDAMVDVGDARLVIGYVMRKR